MEETTPWPCTWKEAEKLQLRRGAARPLADHIRWLEEASEFAEQFSRAKWLVVPESLRKLSVETVKT